METDDKLTAINPLQLAPDAQPVSPVVNHSDPSFQNVFTHNTASPTVTAKQKKKKTLGRWTDDEHVLFVEALKKYGK